MIKIQIIVCTIKCESVFDQIPVNTVSLFEE